MKEIRRGYERIWKTETVHAVSLASILDLNSKWTKEAWRRKEGYVKAKITN